MSAGQAGKVKIHPIEILLNFWLWLSEARGLNT